MSKPPPKCRLILGDCLEIMQDIPDGSIDMVMVDVPYGTTACKWDSIIPLEPMWKHLKRIIKKNGAIVMTTSQPFTSVLVCSNINQFKHEWIWEKAVGSNFATLKYQPMKEHENIIVFGKGRVNYYPIMQARKGSGAKRLKTPYHTNSEQGGECIGKLTRTNAGKDYDKEMRNPSSVQFFNNRASGDRGLHPTQKPVALMEYLIKTYTNEGETVLDFTMGSGTTGVACKNLGRDFIGIELDKKYFEIAKRRIRGT